MVPQAKLAIGVGKLSVGLTGTGLIPAIGVVAVGAYAVVKIVDHVTGGASEPRRLNDREPILRLARSTVLADNHERQVIARSFGEVSAPRLVLSRHR